MFLTAVIKHPAKASGKKGFILAYSSGLQSLMVGKSWQEEIENWSYSFAGKKQRVVDA